MPSVFDNAAQAIEAIFVGHASQIDGVKMVLPYEPGTVDRKAMPLITMLFLIPEGVEVETGPREDVDYAWEISLYIALTDWQRAQEEMRDMSVKAVANFRTARNDYNSSDDFDMKVRSFLRRNPPTAIESDSILRASWELHVTVDEE